MNSNETFEKRQMFLFFLIFFITLKQTHVTSMMDFITHNALLTQSHSGLCSVTSVAMATALSRDIIRHHNKRPSVGTEMSPRAQRSEVRWWTWRRTRGGAGCGPAGGREERPEPRWPPPPTPAASAPSSGPFCEEVTSEEVTSSNTNQQEGR